MTRRGKEWTSRDVSRILRSHIYMGRSSWRYGDDKDDVVFGAVQPIVSSSVFQEAGRKLARKKQSKK
jgi:hypothetical protein